MMKAVDDSGAVCMTIHADGKAAAIFGAVWVEQDVGSPWMLGSDLVSTVPFEMVRQGRIWVDWVSRIYPTLINYVDERNTSTINWLELVGFTFDGAGHSATHHDTAFRRFSRCANP